VKFVRKRDPRYKAHLARQAQATQPQSKPAQPKTDPKGTLRTPPLVPEYVEQDWQKPDTGALDHHLDWVEAEGDEAEQWECVACAKTFRSEAAWASHERSRKHLKEVERLWREMQHEDETLGLQEAALDPAEQDSSEQTELPTPSPSGPAVIEASETGLPVPYLKLSDGVDEPLDAGKPRNDPASVGLQGINSRAKQRCKPVPRPTTKLPKSAIRSLERGTIIEGFSSVSTGEGSVADRETPDLEVAYLESTKVEMSKRDKRRAKEAKKAQGGVLNVQAGHTLYE
jgi:DnaJ homolog subfamily A member 5